ncbi:8483_t:CDS:1, partial [Ambispora gerdemannii]
LTNPAKKREKPPRPQNSWIIFQKDYEANLRLFDPNVKHNIKHTAKKCCSLKWKHHQELLSKYWRKWLVKNHVT